jgi:hypothetical protein
MTASVTDPFIALLPDPHLSGFYRLPLPERRWRARIYWVTYVWTGSAPFAWAVAMNRDPDEVAEMRTFVANTDDGWIMEGLHHVDARENPGLAAALADLLTIGAL